MLWYKCFTKTLFPPSDFLLSWLLPSPEESVSSVEYHFLLFRPEIPGSHCCLFSGQQLGKKGGCRKRMNRVLNSHFNSPPPPLRLPHIQYIRYPTLPYTGSCILWPNASRCAIKPLLFILFTHNRWGETLQIWSRVTFGGRRGFLCFFFGWLGRQGGFLPLDFKWHMLAVWCYKSKMGLSSKGGKHGEAQIRPQLEIISAHLSLADKPPHCTSKTYSRHCLMLGSARVCKRKHFFVFFQIQPYRHRHVKSMCTHFGKSALVMVPLPVLGMQTGKRIIHET